MQRELRLDGLLLRPPRPGDAVHAHRRWAADAQTLRYLEWPPHADVAQTQAQLDWDLARWLKGSAWTWLLQAVDVDGPIGMVQLTPISPGRTPHHLRLGYVMGPAWQGHGWMRAAVATVCEQAWRQDGVWRIDALCDVDNLRSERLLAALGWQREGRLACHAHHPNVSPRPRDVHVWAQVRTTASPWDTAPASTPRR